MRSGLETPGRSDAGKRRTARRFFHPRFRTREIGPASETSGRGSYLSPLMSLRLVLVLFSLASCHTLEATPEGEGDAGWGSAPSAVTNAVEGLYPAASIHEVERETRDGAAAWEVELTTAAGDDLEVVLSESGRVLGVEEELPLIGGELSAGLGAMWSKSIYKDADDEMIPIPMFDYRNGPLGIRSEEGLLASCALFRRDGITAGILGALRIGDGFEEDDSDALKGMDEPEFTTLLAGAFGTYEFDDFEIEFRFANEMLDEHGGQEVALGVSYAIDLNWCVLEPSLSAEFLSSRWTDYYFGVSRSESRSDRRAYDPGSALNFEAGLMLRAELGGGFELIGLVEFTVLDSEIKDSPIVDEDYEFEVGFGIEYEF